MGGSGVNALEILTGALTLWWLVNLFIPMPRLGIRSRKSAFVRLLLSLAALLIIADISGRSPSASPQLTVQTSNSEATDIVSVFRDENKRDAWVAKGQEAVLAKLRDPSSASFRNTFFHLARLKGTPVPMSCGEVNSKNGFGGYTGYERYVSAGDANLTLLEEQVADFEIAWKKLCQD
jgi:hypothetical protein